MKILLYNQYSVVFVFFFLSLFLTLILITLSYNLANQKPDIEKLSVYECGFDPFENTRKIFSIRYYLIAILFIIFDLEFLYLIPWIFVYDNQEFKSYLHFFIFLFLLTIGFIYEWKIGALNWND